MRTTDPAGSDGQNRPLTRRRRFAASMTGVFACLGMAATALAGTGATSATAADAPTPAVIPALQNWAPAPGSLTLGPATRIDTDAAGQTTATLLADELSSARGWRVPVVTDAPRPGDIVLRIDTSRGDLGSEGYALNVGSQLTITGNTNTGIFYGTRTLLQLLAQNTSIPDGSTTDVPAYGERAIGVDPMYTYNTEAWFTRLVKDMAYLKLNTLHLELKVKNDQYPAVNTFSYYTPTEVRALVALAATYHITIIPEINAPGHIDPYLTPYPNLQLKDSSGTPDPSRLDITNPDAFTFYTHLIDNDLNVFPGPYFHTGADEYMINSAYSKYPQIQAYARAKFGVNATPQDAYIDFINRVDVYVRSKGRTLRIWNDGLTGANTVPLNKDIVVEYWSRAAVTSQQLINDGYRVMNASSSWYYTRGSYQPNAQGLYNSGWNPLNFTDQTVTNTGNRVSGAEYNVWPDNYGAENENQVQQGMFTSMRAFAQAVWGSPRPTADYAGFTTLATSIGHAPSYGAQWTQPLSGGTYTITNAGGRLTETGATSAALTTSGAATTTWNMIPTSDGYYRLQSSGSGRCADIRPSTANQANPLGVVEQAGASVTAEWCTGTESQKWQLEPGTGGYRIVNATTQEKLQPTSVGQPVVQQPRDVASDDVWSFSVSAATGPVTGYGGKCVDVAAAATANGTAIQLYDCNGTAAQQWTTVGTTLRALGKCMDVTAAATANGTQVQLYDCNGTAAQDWTRGPNNSLVNPHSGRCLNATGYSSTNGTRLQIWDCNTAANQQWSFTTSSGAYTGAIGGFGGKCVDVAGANSANGTAVQLSNCNGTAAQQWTTVGTTLRALGKCMDVTAAATANGTQVQLYDCNGTAAQDWTRGPNNSLVNPHSGRCLNATGYSSTNGTRLQIWDCNTAANQQWLTPPV